MQVVVAPSMDSRILWLTDAIKADKRSAGGDVGWQYGEHLLT